MNYPYLDRRRGAGFGPADLDGAEVLVLTGYFHPEPTGSAPPITDLAAWHDGRARAMYRGAEWDVELAPGEPDDASLYEITALRGNCLIVAAKRPRTHGARDA